MSALHRPFRLPAILLATTVLLAGCAGTPRTADVAASPGQDAQFAQSGEQVPADVEVVADENDPLEGFNRAVDRVNTALDVALVRPAAIAYRAILPQPLRVGISNVLRLVRAPLDFANQVLQGDFGGAGDVLARTAINATVGLAGLVDWAEEWGIPYEYESLDQTLAVWGVPEGPYLVLPLLGPSSLRDGPALILEQFADPLSQYADGTNRQWADNIRTAVTILDAREGVIEAIDDIRRNSLDPYASFRSLYRQRQANLISDGAGDPEAIPEIPDYGEP